MVKMGIFYQEYFNGFIIQQKIDRSVDGRLFPTTPMTRYEQKQLRNIMENYRIIAQRF